MTFPEYQSRRYIPELDGVRAVSVFLVLISHYWRAAAESMVGRLGVTFFFVLSGYLITTLLLREEKERGRVELTGFYIRRTCRIFPLYYLTLAAYCFLILVVGLRPEHREAILRTLPADLCYFQEVPRSAVSYSELPFQQSWSLGIEEKFYLVWPVLGFVLFTSPRSRRLLALQLLAIFACTILLRNAGMPVLARCLFPYFEIVLGCLLGLLLQDERWFRRLSCLRSSAAPLILLAALVPIHELECAFVFQSRGAVCHVIQSVIAALLVASILLNSGWVVRALRWQPIVFVGTISYGIYLIHLLAMNSVRMLIDKQINYASVSIIGFLATCALTLGLAYLLAVLIERPCIRFGRRWAERVRRRRSPAAPFNHALQIDCIEPVMQPVK